MRALLFPVLAQNHTKGQLPRTYSFPSEKREQDVSSALDTLPGRLTWILHHGESLWESVGLDHWGSERSGEKVQSDLGGSHSCLYQCPCGSTCPSAEPSQWSLLAVKSFPWLYPGRKTNLQPIPTIDHSL